MTYFLQLPALKTSKWCVTAKQERTLRILNQNNFYYQMQCKLSKSQSIICCSIIEKINVNFDIL